MRSATRSTRPASRATSCDAGFTLVELIVASTLMVLVLSGIYLTFSTTVRTWRAGESNYAPYQDARRALGLLERELAGIPTNAQHLFSGAREQLEFVTLSPTLDVESAAGLQLIHVRYRIAKVDGIESLIREEAVVVQPLPAPPAPGDLGLPAKLNVGRRSEFVVARDVLDVDLSYQWPGRPQPVPNGGRPPFVPILSTNRVAYTLPQAVSVRLTLRDEGNVSGDMQTRFTQTLTLPFPAGPVPESLVRRGRG